MFIHIQHWKIICKNDAEKIIIECGRIDSKYMNKMNKQKKNVKTYILSEINESVVNGWGVG